MYALYILHAVVGRMDDAGIQKDVDAVSPHLSIMLIEHSLDKFGSIPELHPYGLTPILRAEFIECIQTSVTIPAMDLHSISPPDKQQIKFLYLQHVRSHQDLAKYKFFPYIFIDINRTPVL